MGGRNRDVGARAISRTATKPGTATSPRGVSSVRLTGEAMCPSAQVVMSGQSALQQESLSAFSASAFWPWQGMSICIAISAPESFNRFARGAADTA
ncbi:hypothetical protein WQQ_42060 [Hydrocarboniphaga effusa AP103]|uniref:Uncharacterized protein n=1 Tax=Hydrocarboniphaga effusa AP103 TaxID=1172194 RepID=I8HWP7_9GAMM|nr:hypothetical protein WQQ_42060 [Hydrocarboniphaga effusa AP103]